jgi:uncharacterized protein (DUF58 family)
MSGARLQLPAASRRSGRRRSGQSSAASDTSLQPPAARQGPGPVPPALVQALELALARRAGRALPGDRRAPGVGAGTELSQLRPYQAGEDVRHIDSAATARTNVPHVRLHVPERLLTTWIVLDVSPSMAFGTARRLKADVAEGAALVLGQLAVRRGGGLALLTFGGGTLRMLPPRTSRPALVGLRRVLDEGVARDGSVAQDGSSRPHALARALARLGAVARQPGLVAVVSDFRDQHGWLRPLGSLRVRHSVLAIEVSDPRERELPAVGRLALVDPETGERLEVDTSNRRVRKRFAALERERSETLTRELRRLRVDHVTLGTDEDWLRELGRRLR